MDFAGKDESCRFILQKNIIGKIYYNTKIMGLFYRYVAA